MGFEINLLIVLPSICTNKPLSRRECTIWRTKAIVAIGRVSGVVRKEALFTERSPKERAALYLTECMWSELCKNADDPSCFAPPFGIMPQDPEDVRPAPFYQWWKYVIETPIKGNEFLRASGGVWSPQIPGQGMMEEHNECLRKRKVSGKVSPDDLIRRLPLMWFPCAQVAKWIETGRKEKSWLTLRKKDKEALAHFAIWKSCLTEMGKAGGKCLFLFKDIYIDSLVG